MSGDLGVEGFDKPSACSVGPLVLARSAAVEIGKPQLL
jgi:hypothetical protein